MKQKKSVPQKTVAAGQVWQLADSNIEITLVGRTLVHFKHVKQGVKRAPTSLLGREALESFLVKNKALLVQYPGGG